MGCSICTYLERALESRNGEYLKARSSTYRLISTRFVAYRNVEMERAKSELAMHRSVCVSAVASNRISPVLLLPLEKVPALMLTIPVD
jgi:hypothetical protein